MKLSSSDVWELRVLYGASFSRHEGLFFPERRNYLRIQSRLLRRQQELQHAEQWAAFDAARRDMLLARANRRGDGSTKPSESR